MADLPVNFERGGRPIAVDLSELTGLRWEEFFGNDAPVELEIGTGKGGFLVRRAETHPQCNFLGIEWANAIYRYVIDRLRRRRIANVRMLRVDAGYFVRQCCPRDSLAALHTYHPDPWPKKRHHRRRLFQRPFVEAAVACLRPGARWAVQTDHVEYFAQIEPLLRAQADLEEIPFGDVDFGVEDDRLATNFEIKYLREGRAMYRLAFRRRPH